MEYVIKSLTAFGIVIGAIDMILKNRWKLGDKFQQGFSMMGSMMFSMVGIIMIAPTVAIILKNNCVPFLRALHMDPSILSIFFSCDMGGYALSQSLADNPSIGIMNGIITAGMFGGALSFTIPLGFGMLEQEVIPNFSKGVLFGLGCIPIGNLIGGTILNIPLISIIWNSLPVIILSVLIIIGITLAPAKMVKAMEILAICIKILGIIGFVLGSLNYLLDVTIIPGMDSLTDSMLLVCEMTITMIGMLPLTELISRILKKPLQYIGTKIGLDTVSVSGLILSTVSCTPVFPMMKRMYPRGQIINGAWAILVSAVFGSQLGLTLNACPEALPALFAGKFAAGFFSIFIITLYDRKNNS